MSQVHTQGWVTVDNGSEYNHFQTCIKPSVLPVRIHVFDIATAEIVSWWPDGGVSGPWPPSSEFLDRTLLPPTDDGAGPSLTNTSCTTFVPSINRCLEHKQRECTIHHTVIALC